MKTHSAKVFMSSEHTLNDTKMMHVCCTFVQTHKVCTTTHFIKVNPKMNWGPWWLWCKNTVHPWFKKIKDSTLLVIAMHVREGSICKISLPSCQFCYKSKTALKNSQKLNTQGRYFWQNFYFSFILLFSCYCVWLCNPMDCRVLLNTYTDYIYMCVWWTVM